MIPLVSASLREARRAQDRSHQMTCEGLLTSWDVLSNFYRHEYSTIANQNERVQSRLDESLFDVYKIQCLTLESFAPKIDEAHAALVLVVSDLRSLGFGHSSFGVLCERWWRG